MSASSIRIRKIVLSALFLSIALIIKTFFSFYVPLFGENGMKISVSDIFVVLPSILFGPIYGGAVSGLSDLLGYLLKPTAAYVPLLTLTAVLCGAVRGLLWMLLRRCSAVAMRVAVILLVAVCGLLGVWNIVSLASDGVDAAYYETADGTQTDSMHMISRILLERTRDAKDPGGSLTTFIIYTTWGLTGFAALGAALLLADLLLAKIISVDNKRGNIMGILLSMTIAGLMLTSINTVILRETVFESWKLLPFFVVWLPRAIEAIVLSAVNAFFVVSLYGVFLRQKNLRALVTKMPARASRANSL